MLAQISPRHASRRLLGSLRPRSPICPRCLERLHRRFHAPSRARALRRRPLLRRLQLLNLQLLNLQLLERPRLARLLRRSTSSIWISRHSGEARLRSRRSTFRARERRRSRRRLHQTISSASSSSRLPSSSSFRHRSPEGAARLGATCRRREALPTSRARQSGSPLRAAQAALLRPISRRFRSRRCPRSLKRRCPPFLERPCRAFPRAVCRSFRPVAPRRGLAPSCLRSRQMRVASSSIRWTAASTWISSPWARRTLKRIRLRRPRPLLVNPSVSSISAPIRSLLEAALRHGRLSPPTRGSKPIRSACLSRRRFHPRRGSVAPSLRSESHRSKRQGR